MIPGQYIVVFRDAVADPAALADRLVQTHGGAVLFRYASALRGFAARLPEAAVTALLRHPEVAYLEADRRVTLDATQSMDANGDPWGLDRIDERSLPLSGSYTYTRTGSGVRAYIIDTGIYTAHSQFGGRASNVYDVFGGNGQDCNGHGTHVAGTVGAATWGVAKQAYLRGVRVLNCSGSGTISGIIAGVDWVRQNHLKPAVANLSLGGGFSSSLNTAVTNLANAGVFVAVAAGNSNADACNYSPASASAVYTAAASTRSDSKASYSNWGTCVDGYAPGSAIKSSWLNGGTNTISGTSMASPHVAGVAVLYKSNFGDASQSTITSWINTNATTGVIQGNVSGTPNRLLYKSTL
ncbi:MAG TPA: S8 family peptidase [Gemmatimonadales bacterium]|nr:S8 family peptidase [Gemmatimonadales bacterium]